MPEISIRNKDQFVDEFLKEYLENGMGTMSKREIDILVMHLFLRHGDLANRSNHDLSIRLRSTESRIRGLRYEARLKYPPDKDYVKREFLVVLARAQFELDRRDEQDLDRMRIIFVLEDEYLRHALQGTLKEKGMFADTSFNTEIVRIECAALVSVLAEMYGEQTAADFKDGFANLLQPEARAGAFREAMLKFVLDTARSVFSTIVMAELKTRLGL